jgi:hypothetical protein
VDVGLKPDGTRRQAYRRGFRTKAEAQEALDQQRGDRRDGTFVSPLRQSFGDFLTNDWLPTIQRELARSTWEDYERKIRNHVLPHLGRIPIQALDAITLNHFYTHLLERGRLRGTQSPGLKPRTVRYIHTIVHAALDDAVRWRRIKLNPADQANPPSSSESKAPEMKAWTREQLLLFLARCEGDRYYYPGSFRPLQAADEEKHWVCAGWTSAWPRHLPRLPSDKSAFRWRNRAGEEGRVA